MERLDKDRLRRGAMRKSLAWINAATQSILIIWQVTSQLGTVKLDMARLSTDPPWDQHMDPVFENSIANRSDDSSQLCFFIGVIAMRVTQFKVGQFVAVPISQGDEVQAINCHFDI